MGFEVPSTYYVSGGGGGLSDRALQGPGYLVIHTYTLTAISPDTNTELYLQSIVSGLIAVRVDMKQQYRVRICRCQYHDIQTV